MNAPVPLRRTACQGAYRPGPEDIETIDPSARAGLFNLVASRAHRSSTTLDFSEELRWLFVDAPGEDPDDVVAEVVDRLLLGEEPLGPTVLETIENQVRDQLDQSVWEDLDDLLQQCGLLEGVSHAVLEWEEEAQLCEAIETATWRRLDPVGIACQELAQPCVLELVAQDESQTRSNAGLVHELTAALLRLELDPSRAVAEACALVASLEEAGGEHEDEHEDLDPTGPCRVVLLTVEDPRQLVPRQDGAPAQLHGALLVAYDDQAAYPDPSVLVLAAPVRAHRRFRVCDPEGPLAQMGWDRREVASTIKDGLSRPEAGR